MPAVLVASVPKTPADRLYLLRKLGVKLGVIAGPPRLANHAPATALEYLRLITEEPRRTPTRDDLLVLGADPDLPESRRSGLGVQSLLGYEENLRRGWLLLSHDGPSEIITRALHNFSALTLALALRSRDPSDDEDDVDYDLEAANERESAKAIRMSSSALHRSVAALREANLGEKRFADVESELTVRANELSIDAEISDRNARYFDDLALASRRARVGSRARHRHSWWGALDDILVDDLHWDPADIVSLVRTGAGPSGKPGWAFPLCPLDCARPESKIDQSLRKDRQLRRDLHEKVVR